MATAGILALAVPWGTGVSVGTRFDCRQRLGAGAAPTRVEAYRGRNGNEGARPKFPETVGPRPDVGRTMHHDDPAIRQALIVLGQAVSPIRVVGPDEIRGIYARTPDAGAPRAGLNAFRAPDTSDPTIYVNRDSHVYRSAARRPSALALLKLAATLVHEQVHDTDRDFAAYRLQADFVRSRMQSMPRRDKEAARLYLQGLDARASALADAERRNATWKEATPCEAPNAVGDPQQRRAVEATRVSRASTAVEHRPAARRDRHRLVRPRWPRSAEPAVARYPRSVITKAELLYGVDVSPRRTQDASALAAFLPYVEVLDFPDDAARHYAEIRADLKRRGAMIGANGLLIAAHARCLRLTLVTNNTAEFGRVRRLTLENWTLPGRRARSAGDK